MSQQERVKVKHDDESSVSEDESMGKDLVRRKTDDESSVSEDESMGKGRIGEHGRTDEVEQENVTGSRKKGVCLSSS